MEVLRMKSTDILPEKRTFTPAEVADIMSVTVQTVRNWIDDGTLPCIRINRKVRRIRRDDLLIIISPTE
jgi:excisionase family DNA binding protein